MAEAKPKVGSRRKARDIMQTELLTVGTSTPLDDVERLLGEHRIGGVPVTDETGHLVGVVSMRDLIEHYAEEPGSHAHPGFYHHVRGRSRDEDDDEEDLATFGGSDGDGATASDIMTGEVFAVEADTSLREVAKEMLRLRIHRILVKEKGKHVGLISAFDLLEAFVN